MMLPYFEPYILRKSANQRYTKPLRITLISTETEDSHRRVPRNNAPVLTFKYKRYSNSHKILKSRGRYYCSPRASAPTPV